MRKILGKILEYLQESGLIEEEQEWDKFTNWKGCLCKTIFFCDLSFLFRIKFVNVRKQNLLQVNADCRRNVLDIFLHFTYAF